MSIWKPQSNSRGSREYICYILYTNCNSLSYSADVVCTFFLLLVAYHVRPRYIVPKHAFRRNWLETGWLPLPQRLQCTSLWSRFVLCCVIWTWSLTNTVYWHNHHKAEVLAGSGNPSGISMMTSSNGNIFRVTGHLGGEFTPVNSPHKCQWRGALMLSLICAWING